MRNRTIQLYIHHKVKLNLGTAHRKLTYMDDSSGASSNYYFDCDDDDKESRTLAGQLVKYFFLTLNKKAK